MSSVTNLNATHGIVAADGAFCTGSNALNGSIRFRNKAAFDAWYASRIHSKAQTGQVPIQVAMRQSRIGQTADGETMVVASINPESSRYAITLRVVQLAAAPQSS